MPRTRRHGRIYWRKQGGERTAYADCRDFGDVGGRLKALVSKGEHRATTGPEIVETPVARRLAEVRELKRNKKRAGNRAPDHAGASQFRCIPWDLLPARTTRDNCPGCIQPECKRNHPEGYRKCQLDTKCVEHYEAQSYTKADLEDRRVTHGRLADAAL